MTPILKPLHSYELKRLHSNEQTNQLQYYYIDRTYEIIKLITLLVNKH